MTFDAAVIGAGIVAPPAPTVSHCPVFCCDHRLTRNRDRHNGSRNGPHCRDGRQPSPVYADAILAGALVTARAELPKHCEYERCGTIWVAADESEMGEVHRKTICYMPNRIETEILDAAQIDKPNPTSARPRRRAACSRR